MRRVTIMIIPDGASSARQFHLPRVVVKFASFVGMLALGISGFLVIDYLELVKLRRNVRAISAENEGLKGEARILENNLEDVKRSLRRVNDYASKLSDLTQLRVRSVSKKTGIGPLSMEEYQRSTAQDLRQKASGAYLPVGLNLDKLAFRSAFDRLGSLGADAEKSAIELQQLLSNMSQHQNMLSSIPAVNPVNGWITSGFGRRISPFTGDQAQHKGLDIASPIGTPIFAPADGVVVFTGAKEGFGNFIMIAHGYGIVSAYGHNAQNMVQPGQAVSRGDQIGTVGMTGRTTGPHLHYEVWVNGRTVDPKRFILDMEDNSSI